MPNGFRQIIVLDTFGDPWHIGKNMRSGLFIFRKQSSFCRIVRARYGMNWRSWGEMWTHLLSDDQANDKRAELDPLRKK